MRNSAKTHALNKKSFIRYSLQGIKLELASWKDLLRNEWPLALALLILVAALIVYAKPFPPKEVKIASGQPGSSFNIMASRYAEFFKKHGVTLKTIETVGVQESQHQLVEKNDIQSALLLAGSIKKNQTTKISSLGSVQQVPLWLFYRGAPYDGDDPFEHFVKDRISIGAPGSGTQLILKELLSLHTPLLFDKPQNILHLTHADAAEALIKGEIAAMAIAEGYTSPIIQKLLKQPDIHIYNFSLAPAYEKKVPYLEMVTIPRGSLNLETIYPKSDIKMVSSSMVLLIEKDLHPAIQLLFLMASDEFGDARDQFFARPDEFPSYRDHSVPLSPVAKSFFDSGPSVFTRFVPFWVASFIDRMWLLVLAIVTVAFPLIRLLPNYRQTRVRIQISTAYEDLREIETLLQASKSKENCEEVLAELDALELAISELEIPPDNLSQYYSLCSALNMIRKNALDRLTRYLKAEND